MAASSHRALMGVGPSMRRSGRFWAFLQVSRANLLLTSTGHATLGLLLGAGSLAVLWDPAVPMFIALHFSIAFMACNLNCLYDYDVDRLYKRYMSDNVDILGRRTLKAAVLVESGIALAMMGGLLYTGHPVPVTAAVLGIGAAVSYSVEPVRIKRRGALSQLPILLGLYTLPILGGWFVFHSTLTSPFPLFVIGYALMNEGFTLVNVCEDYSEDRSTGIRTWAHILGLRKTLRLAYALALSGLLCVAYLGYRAYPESTTPLGAVLMLSVILAGYMILAAALEVREVGRGKNLERRAKIYGRRLQKWFMMGRYPLMLTALLLLL